MSQESEIRELIDSFIEYRRILQPLQENLHLVAASYEAVRTDLENLSKSFSGESAGRLDRVHQTLSSQAKSGQELLKKIDEYSLSGEKYARAVEEMTKKFADVSKKLEALDSIERAAADVLGRLESLIAEKSATYNLKELQKSLDGYNKNVERISEFINRDIAQVLTGNAEKIESIKRDNEELSKVVAEQGKSVENLAASYASSSQLLKKTVEGGSVNEQYIFDILDKWAADRKVKIKK